MIGHPTQSDLVQSLYSQGLRRVQEAYTQAVVVEALGDSCQYKTGLYGVEEVWLPPLVYQMARVIGLWRVMGRREVMGRRAHVWLIRRTASATDSELVHFMLSGNGSLLANENCALLEMWVQEYNAQRVKR